MPWLCERCEGPIEIGQKCFHVRPAIMGKTERPFFRESDPPSVVHVECLLEWADPAFNDDVHESFVDMYHEQMYDDTHSEVMRKIQDKLCEPCSLKLEEIDS